MNKVHIRLGVTFGYFSSALVIFISLLLSLNSQQNRLLIKLDAVVFLEL